jgi:hypothetical protein
MIWGSWYCLLVLVMMLVNSGWDVGVHITYIDRNKFEVTLWNTASTASRISTTHCFLSPNLCRMQGMHITYIDRNKFEVRGNIYFVKVSDQVRGVSDV